MKIYIKMDCFCRGCLNSFDDPADLLPYTEESRRLFVYSTGLQVKRNDLFTFQLCKECYLSTKTSCKFKKMCRTSDKNIKNYLALKQIDDGLTFSTFLKRNEDSITFRLPLLSGGNTPNQKAKDEDNESTCTSIQNFMTDILRAEEIPDTEARIIREVIAEEADVMEDSLDSHWLQDDISIDSDFRMDLSLSRFSTPHSTNNDRMHSPERRDVTSTDITSGEDYDNIPIDISLKNISDPSESVFVQQNGPCKVQNIAKNTRCVIDKNLEKALQNENNQEFSLSELLASPYSEFPSKSGASTPTIKQILFGDKANLNKKTKSPKIESEDLDLLLGNLEKTKSYSQKSQEDSHKEKVNFGKLNSRKEVKIDFVKTQVVKSVKNKSSGKLHESKPGKLNEGKIDLGQFSAGKILQEKLNYSKGKLYEEKMELSKSRKLLKGKGKYGKICVEKFDIENYNIENIQESKPDLKKIPGKLRQDKLDIDILFDDKSGEDEFHAGDLPDGPLLEQRNINVEEQPDNMPLNPPQPADELMEDESDDDILEEFLNSEKEKLANVEMKKRAVTNLVQAAQINDAELTELLQEAYDHNIELMKGRKVLNIQSPDKEEKHTKQMISPVESKYCISNFYCKMCKMKFKSLKALKIHFTKYHKYKIDTGKAPWKVKIKMCDQCGKEFTNNKSLIIHLKNHDKPTEYQCKKCALKFKSQNALNNHKITHLGPGDEKPFIKPKNPNLKYICDICGTISTSASNHLTHLRRHTKSYTVHCDECGQGFYRKTELNLHKRRHTGEKPFPCPYCEKCFSRRDGLNRHVKYHTDEKPHQCQYCNSKFPFKNELKVHQQSAQFCLALRKK